MCVRFAITVRRFLFLFLQAALRQQQQRLLLLRHASKCPAEGEQCKVTPHCQAMKRLWKHIAECKNQQCPVREESLGVIFFSFFFCWVSSSCYIFPGVSSACVVFLACASCILVLLFLTAQEESDVVYGL